MTEIKRGFMPEVYNDSRILILGSFPSVKSRQTQFYYGNPQNRFWRTLCEIFGESVPKTVDEKRAFLKRNKIALWDIVTECEIEGSQDATIKNYKIAKLEKVLDKAPIELIILNGAKAYDIFFKNYAEIGVKYVKLSSTSPANVRYNKEEWQNAIRSVIERA